MAPFAPARHAYSPLPDSPTRATAAERDLDVEKLGLGLSGERLTGSTAGGGQAQWSREYEYGGRARGSGRRRWIGAGLAGLVVLVLAGGWWAAAGAGGGGEAGLAPGAVEQSPAAPSQVKPVAAWVGPVPPSPMRTSAGVTTPEPSPSGDCLPSSFTPHPSNVHPHPRPPPPCSSPSERYLAFTPHSGFHNQASALANALSLAHALNRTLLLPPARLGTAAPWTPASRPLAAFHEDCKRLRMAGHAFAPDDECVDPRGEGRFSPDHWTYVGWDMVMEPGFLGGHGVEMVDRWNLSQAWMELPRSEGGLGVKAEEVWTFPDEARRSYQLYDSRGTRDKMYDTWQSRINIPDLRAAPFADKKVLQFGSLFGFGRLNLARQDSRQFQERVWASMVLSEPAINGISDAIKGRLGTYVGVHLRVGDGVFARTAGETFPGIFREVAEGVLGVGPVEVDELLTTSAKAVDKMEAAQEKERLEELKEEERKEQQQQDSRLLARGFDDEAGKSEDDATPPAPALARRSTDQSWWPRPPSSVLPLSANTTCHLPLHPANSPLAPLNTPIFLATDARDPHLLSPFLPFLTHLPCLFTLADFASPTPQNNNDTISALADMMGGGRVSEWDGVAVGGWLIGLLDAVVAAKGDAMVGTPRSTFSGYAKGILHEHFVEEWEEEEGRRKAPGGM